MTITILLLLALLAANLPWFSERLFYLIPVNGQQKAIGWSLLELIVLYFIVGALALFIERKVGQNAPQGWEFYAITATLFLTLAFPGFVWRYLTKRRSR